MYVSHVRIMGMLQEQSVKKGILTIFKHIKVPISIDFLFKKVQL